MFHVKHSITHQAYPQSWFDSVDDIYERNRDALVQYAEQLLWWNSKVNLISRDVSRETLLLHIKHSLLISKLNGFKEAQSVLDTGTGGGLPGLPLAIAYPDKSFVLNDIVQKKIKVINQIKRTVSAGNLSTNAGSIADVPTETIDLIISKHAFKVNDLLAFLNHEEWKEIILLKGIDFQDELEGIEEVLDIQVYDLFEESQHEFYTGKAVLSITKK